MPRSYLPFVVECKSMMVFSEVIAAFDCEKAAKDYAFECSATNPGYEYAVYDRSVRGRRKVT